MYDFERPHLAPRESIASPRSRIVILGLLIVLTLTLLTVRLWRLQILDGENLQTLSESNRLRLIRTPPLRGVMYDRRGQLLVDNRPAYDVVLVPEDTPDMQKTIDAVSKYLESGENFSGKITRRDPRRPSYEGVVLAKDVSWPTITAVETHQLDIPGVSIEISTRRYYPANGFAAHLFGYVGEVSPRELAQWSAYRMGDLIGKFGIEKKWESMLRGKGGGQQVEVDAVGKRLRVLGSQEAIAGQSLVLTIEAGLQRKAEELLEGKEGSIVALDVHSGEVLAMASRPVFDPNVFARGITAEEWRSLTGDPLHPLSNRAIQGQYPPGSTFKVIMAAAALEKGVVSPSTRFFCSGGLPFGRRVFRCWKKRGHGSMDLRQAIAQSCDVYFYQVGQRLGINAIAEYARKFGMGAPLGVALDHEAGGLIPDSEWKKQRLGAPWYAGETLSVAIGQGYVTATPLQMAVVAATVANGGVVYRPHLVKRILGDDGEPIKEYEPEILKKTGVNQRIMQIVRDGMVDVVNARTGTGKKAQLPTILVAGKTGTSQVISGTKGKGKVLPRQYRDHAWFIAFAPADAPEIAIVCLLEHAGEGGGAAAAPVAKELLAEYFAITRGEEGIPHEVRQEAHLAF
jgi:penicillin-binding protein 2